MKVVSQTAPLAGATPLYTAAGTRALDRAAIEDHGVPGYDLMNRAGQCVFRTARSRWPEAQRWHILCGAGNNAGDGYVIARLARDNGLDVQVSAIGPVDKLKGDARKAFEDFEAAGGQLVPWRDGGLEADLVVDALLGTGLDRNLEGPYRLAVDAANVATCPVIAVDIPTGLHADTGAILGVAVHADITATFIAGKQGLFTGQGPACAGDIVFDSLAVPRDVYAAAPPDSWLVDHRILPHYLPPRASDAHKGTCGFVAVLGGDEGMPGAVRLAGEAALRTGAGMVKVATHASHAALIPLSCAPLMATGVFDAEAVDAAVGWSDVLAIGPGLGRSDWSQMVFEAALASPKPKIVDADALNLLAEAPRHSNSWVLTPHPGEASRLLGVSTAEVQADRFGAVTAIQERFGGSCVLKGSGTVIASANRVDVCGSGNPGMATAGMGDVLTGVIAGLVAQGLSLEVAAVLGTCVHAIAGDRAAGDRQRGLLATDVVEALRDVVNPNAS